MWANSHRSGQNLPKSPRPQPPHHPEHQQVGQRLAIDQQAQHLGLVIGSAGTQGLLVDRLAVGHKMGTAATILPLQIPRSGGLRPGGRALRARMKFLCAHHRKSRGQQSQLVFQSQERRAKSWICN